ncbi:MAG: SDR family oxidoreductase [Steroidobacteraceae bacterium]
MSSTAPRPRTTVITGARSGIGQATHTLLGSRGERVIGIDIRDSTIEADLSTAEGRATAIGAVHRHCKDGLEAFIACAGVSASDGPTMVSVNFFGAVALATGLRDLLALGNAPRCVMVSSSATLLPSDPAIVAACLEDDESRARSLAATQTTAEPARRQGEIYAASKLALSRWVRRQAARSPWAGDGILLNGVAPGLVRTPMTQPLLATEDGRKMLAAAVPRALENPAEAADIALLLAFLASPDNRYLVGQTLFCDGGTNVLIRGDAAV